MIANSTRCNHNYRIIDIQRKETSPDGTSLPYTSCWLIEMRWFTTPSNTRPWISKPILKKHKKIDWNISVHKFYQQRRLVNFVKCFRQIKGTYTNSWVIKAIVIELLYSFMKGIVLGVRSAMIDVIWVCSDYLQAVISQVLYYINLYFSKTGNKPNKYNYTTIQQAESKIEKKSIHT